MGYQIPLLILIVIQTSIATHAHISKPGCKDHCGNISIPYPFGIGPKCYHNPWFNVKCTKNHKLSLAFLGIPVRRFFNPAKDHERTLVISTSSTGLCGTTNAGSTELLKPTTSSYDLHGSPFLYSKKHNVLLVGGCGGSVIMVDRRLQTVAGCAALCVNGSEVSKNCYGLGCCQTTIPFSLDHYGFKVVNLRVVPNVSECLMMALVDSSSTLNKAIDTQLSGFSPAPTVLEWRVTDLPIHSTSYANSSCEVRESGGDDGGGYFCQCKDGFYQGNPYLPHGCQVVKECEGCVQECIHYGNETYGCPSLKNSTSKIKNSSTLEVALGVGLSSGLAVLLFGAYSLCHLLKKRRDIRLKAKYFERNGGLLLKEQMASEDHSGSFEKIRIFTSHELEKATDGYNDNRILGQGGQGTVFKGMLVDGRIVAIKRSKIVNERQLKTFINEMVLLSQINHRNVVKLLGCCLETQVPLLVYEYVPNGSLSQHIHDPNEEFPLTWEMRLQIATDIANALAYMHSSSWIPIFHRDIKSSNILLDSKYRAKLSDFGISKSMSTDQTHITTRVQGTFGYMDPEYFQSNQFTDKSDVYSFGVVLVELLTGEKAVRSAEEEERGLVPWFLSFMESDSLDDILDARILKEGGNEEVGVVANLARRCLSLDGKRRPCMKEIAAELETIKSTRQVLLTRGLLSFNHTYDETSFSRTSTFSFQDEV